MDAFDRLVPVGVERRAGGEPDLDLGRIATRLAGKNVPGQLRAKIAEYVEGYKLYDHVLQAGRNPKRMAELGLTEYGLERFALAGNVNDWIERIGALAELGASRLWLSTEAGGLDRQIHYMKVFAEQIMPHFR